MHGKPASTASCGTMSNLEIRFWSPGNGSFGFAPVPCQNGSFFVDKFPTIYTWVDLGSEGSIGTTTADIDPLTGEAMVRLP